MMACYIPYARSWIMAKELIGVIRIINSLFPLYNWKQTKNELDKYDKEAMRSSN